MNQPPRYGIPQLGWPLVSHCEFFGWFDANQCKDLLSLGELLAFKPGAVGNNMVESGVRDSNVAWIDDNPNGPNHQLRVWLINHFAAAIGRVNRDRFQVDLDHFHPPQFTKYDLNQHYNWHTDAEEGKEAETVRKLSAVLMLTGPEEYEGGELELNINGNPEKTLKLKPPAGTIVFFNAAMPHRVLPVTEGTRASIVVWAEGPKNR
jgi:PKHD-type hydroxylase